MAFDNSQNLLWLGNQYGQTSSLYDSQLRRYTSFKTFSSSVYQVLTQEKFVISLGANGIKFNNRRGLLKHDLSEKFMKSLTCMQFGKDTRELMVGGNEDELLKVNLDTMNITSIPYNGTIQKMVRTNQILAASKADGGIDIIDQNSNKVVKSFNTQGGLISDMDARGTVLMTCGYSPKKIGFVLDPLIHVYDLRAGKSRPPIPFPTGSGFVRLHPKLSTCVIIASQSGQIQVLDYVNPANVYLHQADLTSQLVGMEISPSGDYMALTDGAFIQLWNNVNTNSSFVEFASSTEFPDIDLGGPDFPIDDLSTPLSSVGMPYYKEELLSSWSDPSLIFNVGMPANMIDNENITDLKPAAFGGFTGYSKTKIKNVAQKYVSNEGLKKSSSVPKFISEKIRSGIIDDPNELFSDDDSNAIPKIYRRLEIKYSKFGIRDFDFGVYNHTKYSGLEHHLPNAYCNPLLQIYRHSPVFFRFALNQLTYNNLENNSLLSELGLLFDMLQKAQGKHCQALNFLRTLSQIPQASVLGLIFDDHENTRKNISEGLLIQSFCRFLMETISIDERPISGVADFESVAGCPTTIETTIHACGNSSLTKTILYAIELSAPKLLQTSYSFLNLLQESLNKSVQSRGWCESCRKYQLIHTLTTVEKLPSVLNLHMPLGKSQSGSGDNSLLAGFSKNGSNLGEVLLDERFWRVKSWPSADFAVRTTVGGTRVISTKEATDRDMIYDLMGIVIEVSSSRTDKHLVSYIRIDESGKKTWYLFNDFLVKQVTEKEVLNFVHPWKSPVMLVYHQRVDLPPFDVNAWKAKFDTSILYKDHFAAGVREGVKRDYELLTMEEAPKPGTLVAMDAEFVMIHQEETEVISDGTRSLVRPKELQLARVSVVRGEGPKKGVPFIDDFITLREDTIVDYLTQFSGIEPGDLDPALSGRSLVTLQTSYKRLWLLLNLGCVFIGHGLYYDFRTINIQVPESQVIDTLDLYYLPSRQRRLSLRFLAWVLLKQNVQSGNHDSIEDACTALLLYTKYQELISNDSFESTLQNIYSEGNKYNFKPPTSPIPH